MNGPMENQCGTERFGEGRCQKPGEWKHPRYKFPSCQEHKDTLALIFPEGWERLPSTTD